jgi:hypothetical protein
MKRKIMESDWFWLRCITRRNANKLLEMLQWHIFFSFAESGKENAILRSALDYFQFVRKSQICMALSGDGIFGD